MDTLGSLRAEILLELRGDLSSDDDKPLINAKMNNALESIFMAMMKVQLARFFGLDSPVSFTLASGAERVQLVSIPDPANPPVLGQQAGGNLAQRTVLGGYTYVTESGSETQLSPTASLLINANNVGTATAPPAVANAIGWNFYASPSNTAALLALQNQQPLPFNQSYIEPLTGWQDYPTDQQGAPIAQTASGATPSNAPPPSENTTADNISYITRLEVRTSDTLLRNWHQYAIDSDISSRYARTLSSASEYQTYVWDLINGNRLEVRPSAGMQFTPRYFYIAKPRRMRYDQAVIPYQNISGVHEYLTNQAIADLKMTLDEYLASQAFQNKANTNKAEIVSALTQELWNKNTRVQPHLW